MLERRGDEESKGRYNFNLLSRTKEKGKKKRERSTGFRKGGDEKGIDPNTRERGGL